MPFRVGKIRHHKTVLPEVFEYLKCINALAFLHQVSHSSREYSVRHYKILTRVRDDARFTIENSS